MIAAIHKYSQMQVKQQRHCRFALGVPLDVMSGVRLNAKSKLVCHGVRVHQSLRNNILREAE